MSFTATWQRWSPLLAAVAFAALSITILATDSTTPIPVPLLVLYGVVVVPLAWWMTEKLAGQTRTSRAEPQVVYPAHQAAAGPHAWLLTTPDAYRWLGAWLPLTALFVAATTWLQDVVVTGILGAVAAAALLTWLVVWLAALVVVGAILYARRFLLGFLCLPVFAMMFMLTDLLAGRLGIVSPSAQTWLAYGDGVLVAAAAVWWCGTHPRSVDPRTENRSA